MAYLTPHAHVLDTTTQAIATANTVQLITFNTNVLTRKVAHSTSTNPSRLTVNEAGDYLVSYGVQVLGTAANKTLDLWLRITGADVSNSNTKITIVNANDQKRFMVTQVAVMAAGHYIEIVMSGDATSLSIVATAAGTGPTRPVTPSVFLTIEKLV